MILTDKDIRALCTNEKKSTAGMINPFLRSHCRVSHMI